MNFWIDWLYMISDFYAACAGSLEAELERAAHG